MNSRKVPMFQPYVAESAIERVKEVLESRWIGQGKVVNEFERVIEKTLGIPYAVAVNTSSSAIRLALMISEVRPGDEIIATPMTCSLTNHPILEQYARIVFADIQYDSGNIEPSSIEQRITPFTKAIVCCHWGGQPADLEEINEIANRHGLTVIEDASESFGATYRGKPIGAVSRFSAFSFQAIQLLTTGEGGLLAVRDEAAYEHAQILRWYAIDRKSRKSNILGYYDFDISTVGFGYHMTNIAAAIGIENLKHLNRQKEHRKNIVARYRSAFTEVAGITLFPAKNDRESSNHFFTMHVEKREDFCRKMKARDIEVSIVHYRNDAYSVFGGLRNDLPNLDRFAATYICLPTHMSLSSEDIEYIIDTVKTGW